MVLRDARVLSLATALVSARAWAHMGPGVDTESLALLAVIGIGVVSIVQGTLTWLGLRTVLKAPRRLWARSCAYSFVLDAAAVLTLVADDRLHIAQRVFESTGPPGLVRVLPALMVVSWLAWPLLEREAPFRRRLIVSQVLLAMTLGFFVLVMLVLGFNPFA